MIECGCELCLEEKAASQEPPACKGCGGQMHHHEAYYGKGHKAGVQGEWICANGCYYCEHSEGCGYQDQSTYCHDCYGCAEHCACEKFWCDGCNEEVSSSSYCGDDLCKSCCDCDHSTAWGGSGVSGRGLSTQPGWVVRGLTVTITPTKNKDWKQIWAIDNENIDLVQEMANFYVLEFIAHNLALVEVADAVVPDAIRWIAREAEERQQQIVALLDPTFQAYIDMAVGGELRYHRAMSAVGLGKSAFSRESAWINWAQVREQVGPQALLDAAELAREVGGESILGPKWAVPAEILHARITGTIDARTFVDRSFALQHNGGCLFNKIGWARHNRFKWGLEAITNEIGPAHAANPIQWGPLLACASTDVATLFSGYWREANKVRSRLGLGVQTMPTWRDGLEALKMYSGRKYGYVNPLVDHRKNNENFSGMLILQLPNEGGFELFVDAKELLDYDKYFGPVEAAIAEVQAGQLASFECKCKACTIPTKASGQLTDAYNQTYARISLLAKPHDKIDLARFRLWLKKEVDKWYSALQDELTAKQVQWKYGPCPNKQVESKVKTALPDIVDEVADAPTEKIFEGVLKEELTKKVNQYADMVFESVLKHPIYTASTNQFWANAVMTANTASPVSYDDIKAVTDKIVGPPVWVGSVDDELEQIAYEGVSDE